MDMNGKTNQDEIITPPPLAAPPGGAEAGWASAPDTGAPPGQGNRLPPATRALWAVMAVCLLISLLSLALNAVLISSLVSVRQTAVAGLDAAIVALEDLGGKGFHYDYHFSGTIPFAGDIPIQQDLVFPFQGKIPINTTVRVPINAGALGEFTIDVPVNTSFDVDIQVPVSVDQTIHVETEVPLDLVIPIDLQADDPLLAKLIGQVQAWLVELRDSL